MAFISLKSTTTFLFIFSALSIAAVAAAAEVVDLDGEPLLYGKPYYILPLREGHIEGLSLTSKPDNPCPFYITHNTDETSHGIPIIITSPSNQKSPIEPGSSNISFVFQQDEPNICMQPLGWKVVPGQEKGQFYVATGGSGGGGPVNPDDEIFTIEDFVENVYKIKNIAFPNENVGIFKDGLLGITDDDENKLNVVFKKAFTSNLAMKV